MSNGTDEQPAGQELTAQQRVEQVSAVLAFIQELLSLTFRRLTGGWHAREFDQLLCSLQLYAAFMRQKVTRHASPAWSLLCTPVLPPKLLCWLLHGHSRAADWLKEFGAADSGKVLKCVDVKMYRAVVGTATMHLDDDEGPISVLKVTHTYALVNSGAAQMPLLQVPDVPAPEPSAGVPQEPAAPVAQHPQADRNSNNVIEAYLDRVLAGDCSGTGERAVHTAWVQRTDMTPQDRIAARQRLGMAVALSMREERELQDLLSYEAHIILNH